MLAGNNFVTDLHIFESVGSTNDEVRRLAARGAGEGVVVIAREQTAGRGRQGRKWHSAAGLGLYLSVLLRPPRPLEELPRWTLGAAVAAAEACREVTGCGVEIDWPNDLRHGRRKLGGILTEMRSAGSSARELVVGLGLNVNHEESDFPGELRSVATSLRIAAGRGALEVENLASGYLGRLADVSARLRRGEWDDVARRWEGLAPGCRGRRVRLAADGFEGVTSGLDADGALLVRNGEGVTVVVRMADALSPVEI